MCNVLAAADRKISWNSTIPINSDPPINVTIDRKVSQLEPSENSVKLKPALQTQQTGQLVSDTTQVNSAENKLETEQHPIIGTEIEEKSQDMESIQSNHNVENTEDMTIDLTTSVPAIESSEDINDIKNGQNIFNMAGSGDETNSESQDVLVEIPTSTEAITEAVTSNNGLEITPPSVIILPESTTQAPIDLNDVSDEQTNNGFANNQQFGQKLHSESVFLRLSNRVKVCSYLCLY